MDGFTLKPVDVNPFGRPKPDKVVMSAAELAADKALDQTPGNKDELLLEMSRKDLAPGVKGQLEQEYRSLYGGSPDRGAQIANEIKTARGAYTLKPVSYDPFSQTGYTLKPVDYDPFAPDQKPAGLMESAATGLSHGVLGLAEAVNIGLQFIGNRVGSPAMAERGESGAQYWGEKAKAFEAPADIQGSIAENPALLLKGRWWLYNLADTLPSLSASIIPGVGVAKAITIAGKAIPLTETVVERLVIAGAARKAAIDRAAIGGGAIVGGAAGGSLEGAQTYQEVLKRGAPEPEAAAAASMMALASGALNAIAVGKIVSPAKSNALVRFLTTGAVEGLTEWAEEPAEGAILSRTSVAKPEDDPAKRAVQGLNVLPIAAVLGGGAGAMAGRQVEVAPQQPSPDQATTPPAAVAPATAPPEQDGGQPNAEPQSGLPVAESQAPGSSEVAPGPGDAGVAPDQVSALPLSLIDQARADAQILKSGQPIPDA